MKEKLWDIILSVRNQSPLVHNITNYVVMNNTANALLAIGASPIMAHAKSEIVEMVQLANALVVNIGTLDEYWAETMLLAAEKAHLLNKPWVLDPVGAGATSYRTEIINKLLQFKPTVIRGNSSEIIAIAGNNALKTKGVDSTNKSEDAISYARWLNATYGSTICISGATDIIVQRENIYYLNNGHPLMAKVTGLGCTASALVGAMIAVESEALLATTAAMSLLGVVGQLAEKLSNGPGSLQMNLLDKLYSLSESEFMNTLELVS